VREVVVVMEMPSGDIVEVDIHGRKLRLRLSEAEIGRRLRAWKPKQSMAKKGVLRLYQKHVQSVATGAVID
jgi:dihydroxy-acid dehydratase